VARVARFDRVGEEAPADECGEGPAGVDLAEGCRRGNLLDVDEIGSLLIEPACDLLEDGVVAVGSDVLELLGHDRTVAADRVRRAS
jgi:hypothetical protein